MTLTPCLALSSLYFAATSLNFSPAFSRSRASKHFDCFSHRMCLTYLTTIHSQQHACINSLSHNFTASVQYSVLWPWSLLCWHWHLLHHIHAYTRCHYISCPWLGQILTDFLNSFTNRHHNKYQIKSSSYNQSTTHMVNEFWTPVSIWKSFGKEYSGSLFWLTTQY